MHRWAMSVFRWGQVASAQRFRRHVNDKLSSVSNDAWHSLELHLVVNGTASATEGWLDGVKVSDLSWAGQSWG